VARSRLRSRTVVMSSLGAGLFIGLDVGTQARAIVTRCRLLALALPAAAAAARPCRHSNRRRREALHNEPLCLFFLSNDASVGHEGPCLRRWQPRGAGAGQRIL